MSEENKIGTYQFVAEPFHVDFNGRLTMGVLGNHLLNCAGFHASDRGFGIATLNEDNYTWVLSAWLSSWMRCLTSTRSSRFRHGWRMSIVSLPTVTLPSLTRMEEDRLCPFRMGDDQSEYP